MARTKKQSNGFKPITGTNYSVSKEGTIINDKGLEMKTRHDKRGNKIIALRINGKTKLMKVKNLVFNAFSKSKEKEGYFVSLKDFDKDNVAFSNLVYEDIKSNVNRFNKLKKAS